MEQSIRMIAGLSFVIVGLSHVARPRAWARFFIALAEKGEVGSFLVALLHLPVGALIVSLHNVWSGPHVVLTLIGWGYVTKSLVYFVFPGFAARVLARTSEERAWEFAAGGVPLAAYGAFLLYAVARG